MRKEQEMIRRYVREKNKKIYDRLWRRYIQIKSERLIGDRFFINPGTEDEIVIPKDDINIVIQFSVPWDIGCFLDKCLMGCHTIGGHKFKKALVEVLSQIWEEIEPEIHKIGGIIFPDCSSLFVLNSAYPSSKKDVCETEKWIIFFQETLYNGPESEMKHTIAHEFAHFILGHRHPAPQDQEERKRGERATDDLAAKWGFPRIKEGKNK